MTFVFSQVRAARLATAALAGLSAYAFEPTPLQPDKEAIVVTPRAGGSYLGVGVAEVDSARAKTLNLKEERGVEITLVEEEGAAMKAGLKTGDVVLEFNGQRVEGVAQFKRLVQETPGGREVKLLISRAGTQQTVVVKTAVRKLWTSRLGDGGAMELPGFDLPEIRIAEIPRAHMSWRSTSVGIEAETLDSQLAEYFGVKEGVLVRSIAKGSPADKAGFRAGDVIVKIDESRVTTPREISSSIRAARSKKSIPVQIMRERREMSMTLTVDDTDVPLAMPRRAR
ncbi:MAG TPA: PDZ domain-containing protein [Bryobacteraceae bacterium]|nr:PDZ domain-containing protein [Bryobacteraceae bacterium]